MTPQQYVIDPYVELAVQAVRTEALARVYAAAVMRGAANPQAFVQNFINLMSGQ